MATESLSRRVTDPAKAVSLPSTDGTFKEAKLEFEREYVARVLQKHGGNATRAAQALGLSRQMLQRKIKEFDLRGS